MNIEKEISDRTNEIRRRFEENQTIIERRDFIPAILKAYDHAATKAARSASSAMTNTAYDHIATKAARSNISYKEQAIFDEAVCRTIESILEYLRRYDENDNYDTDLSCEIIELPRF